MNRSAYILGVALLVIAATLSVSITMRNAPGDNHKGIRSAAGAPPAGEHHASGLPVTPGTAADGKAPASGNQARHEANGLRVSLHEARMAELPAGQQAAWLARAAAVEADARARLDVLTDELELTASQRERMFPMLVRSAPGYDPIMFAGGTRVATGPSPGTSDETRQALESREQAQIDDQEVDRQLWWHDILSRLETDLIDSTGGARARPATPAVPVTPAADERVAPPARETGNLFDLIPP